MNIDDLVLAYKRIIKFRKFRGFVDQPLLLKWIDSDLDSWIESIHNNIEYESYTPKSATPCFIPKPKNMLRKGVVLDLRDELLYTAILGQLYRYIYEQVKWSQGCPDMAYQLLEPVDGQIDWMKNSKPSWKDWNNKSIEFVEDECRYVLFTDITNFYDNIDLEILSSILLGLNIEQDYIYKLFIRCLHKWSNPNGRGIPQGYSPSDVLAKVYMNPIDTYLKNKDILFLRYVDDFRIFCKTKQEAKIILSDLIKILADKGLSVNGAKTYVLPYEKAKQEIESIIPLINSINQNLKIQLNINSYITDKELDEILNENSETVDPEVLEVVFTERFNINTSIPFNKTLFHFLLTRLGKIKSKIAIEYCISAIEEYPEEMEYILTYLSNFQLKKTDLNQILKYMESYDAIYDYQLYQLVRWFYESNIMPSKLIKLCRKWAFDYNREQWLRSYSLMILGKNGESDDLDNIKRQYNQSLNNYCKAEVVSCIQKMSSSARNSFYSQVRDENDLVSRAVNLARQNRIFN